MCKSCEEAEAIEAARKAEEAAKAPRRILTRETVMAGQPCSTYRTRFIERFPESVEVTVELAVSQSEDWDWFWAAGELLTVEGRKAFHEGTNELDKAYAVTMQPYWNLLDAARKQADRVYAQTVIDERGKRNIPRYHLAEAVYTKTIEVEKAAAFAADKVASLRIRQGEAKLWAEIYISEEGKEIVRRQYREENDYDAVYYDDQDDEDNDW